MNENVIRGAVERGNTAYWDDSSKEAGAVNGSIIDYITRAIMDAAKEFGWCPACDSDCFVLYGRCRGCGVKAGPPRIRF